MRATINEVCRHASTVRDRMSVDAYRIISRIDRHAVPPERRSGHLDLTDVLAILNEVVIDLAAFSGLVVESMTRTQGWRFLEIGRRVERALHTAV